MFSQPQRGEVLRGIPAGYGIEIRHNTQLVEVDGPNHRAMLLDNGVDRGRPLSHPAHPLGMTVSSGRADSSAPPRPPPTRVLRYPQGYIEL
jgi:hypothetical protein